MLNLIEILKKYWFSGIVAVVMFGLGATIAFAFLEFGIAGKIKAKLLPEAQRSIGADIQWKTYETSLLTIETLEIPIGNVDGIVEGGGLDAVGDTVFFVSALGRIGYVDLNSREIAYLEEHVPLNFDALRQSESWGRVIFNRKWFRVHDILLRPQDSGVHELLVSHHYYLDSGDICTRVSRADVSFSNGKPSIQTKFETVFEVSPCINLEDVDHLFNGHMSGGRLHETVGNEVYLTVGDFGFAGKGGRGELVDPGSPGDFASVLLLNLETGSAEIVAEGTRNAQGLDIDDQGRVWITEHGPQGGDEINLVQPGVDLGWPRVTLGFEYAEAGYPRIPFPGVTDQGRHEGYQKPVMAFVPSIGISQILAMPSEAEAFNIWRGDLLAASLKAQSIYRVRLDGDRAIYVEPISMGGRIRDMIFLHDQRIAMLRDDDKLVVLRDPAVHRDVEETKGVIDFAGYESVDNFAKSLTNSVGDYWGQDLFRWKCASCHSVEGLPAVGPEVADIVGEPIGGREGYPYSRALMEADGKWTRSRLKKFIVDPASAGLGGSSMPPVSELNEAQLDAIIKFLEEEAPAIEQVE